MYAAQDYWEKNANMETERDSIKEEVDYLEKVVGGFEFPKLQRKTGRAKNETDTRHKEDKGKQFGCGWAEECAQGPRSARRRMRWKRRSWRLKQQGISGRSVRVSLEKSDEDYIDKLTRKEELPTHKTRMTRKGQDKNSDEAIFRDFVEGLCVELRWDEQSCLSKNYCSGCPRFCLKWRHQGPRLETRAKSHQVGWRNAKITRINTKCRTRRRPRENGCDSNSRHRRTKRRST